MGAVKIGSTTRISSTGAATFTTVAASSSITAASLTTSGAITAASLTTSGNVTVGTSQNSADLYVTDNIHMYDENFIGIGDNEERILFDTAGSIKMYNGDPSSTTTVKLGVNCNPTYPLQVSKGSSNPSYVGLFQNAGSVSQMGLKIQCGTSSTSIAIAVYDAQNSLCGSIQGYGASNTIAFVDGSDERLKSNIKDTDWQGLEKINKIKLRQFDWNESGAHIDIGVVAQEVYDTIPKAVSKPKDELDEKGKISTDNQWGITISELILPLVKAVQELSAKNDVLENRLAEVETNNHGAH